MTQHIVEASDRERLGVTVHMDYAFMTPEEKEEDMQPTLVIFDDDKQSFWALGFEQEGVTPCLRPMCVLRISLCAQN